MLEQTSSSQYSAMPADPENAIAVQRGPNSRGKGCSPININLNCIHDKSFSTDPSSSQVRAGRCSSCQPFPELHGNDQRPDAPARPPRLERGPGEPRKESERRLRAAGDHDEAARMLRRAAIRHCSEPNTGDAALRSLGLWSSRTTRALSGPVSTPPRRLAIDTNSLQTSSALLPAARHFSNDN